jgi:hypothetical protein
VKGIIVVGVAAAALAACGGIAGGSPASTAARTSPSPGAAGLANAVFGQVTNVAAGKLTVNGQGGDATVAYDSSTSVLQSGTGALTDAVPGSCVMATGTADAAGAVTATTFQVQLNMNGNCNTPPAGFGGAGASPRPGASARPNRSPFPGQSPGVGGGAPANLTVVRGKVSAVSGNVVTVQPDTGAAVTVTVPSTVSVTRLVNSTTARLAVGECVTATGQRTSSGTVQARNILISAPGPNGCTRAGGIGGGFGGGRRGSPSPVSQSA